MTALLLLILVCLALEVAILGVVFRVRTRLLPQLASYLALVRESREDVFRVTGVLEKRVSGIETRVTALEGGGKRAAG